MQLLLLSSSRANNSAYLAPYMTWICDHLAAIDELLFIPYAGVSIKYDDYLQKRSGNSLTLLGADGGYLFRGGNKTALAQSSDLTEFML